MGKIVDFDKLKVHPASSYAFLWVIFCFVIALVHLTGVILITKFGSGQVSAASGSAVSACTFSPATVDVGQSIGVWANNANVYGSVTIQGAYLNTAAVIGNLPKKGSVSAVIGNVQGGLYAVRVSGQNCKTASGGDLAVQNIILPSPTPTPIAAPACILNVASVTPGGSVRVTSVGGLFGTIGIQGVFGNPVYSALGTLTANGFTNITVPVTAQAGLYIVRVGALGVPCSPNLAVTTISSPTPTPGTITASCSISPSTIKAGGSLSVTGRGFTALTSNAVLLGLSTTQYYPLGSFNGTSGTYIIPTVPASVYTVRIFANTTGDNGTVCTPDLVIG